MRVDQGALYAANRACLLRRDQSLAEKVHQSVTDTRIQFVPARNGMLVPATRLKDAIVAFHSLYDPEREARNLAASVGSEGCIVLLGLGSGHLARALLDRPGTYAVIIVERSAGVLRALMEKLPIGEIMGDPRVTVVVELSAIHAAILGAWHPALMSGIRTIPLRAWCEAESDFFANAGAMVRTAVESARSDYGVQAHFGKRWMSNIIANLERVQSVDTRPHAMSAARVTAAGPSLDVSLARLREAVNEGALIATDTTLPTLLRSDINPEVVVSIDCQNHGFRHFLSGLPTSTLLVLDLASPPLLARRSKNIVFARSGHPFVNYLSATWKHVPAIDTSGGNVTHAALSLANAWGAKQITLYGADFSYPNGKTYARGTYIHDYFQLKEDRCSPVEAGFYSFLFRSSDVHREKTSSGWRYESPLLSGYRDRLVELMKTLDSRIIPIPGPGLFIPGWEPPASRVHAEKPGTDWGPSASLGDWRDFLSSYADDLAALAGFSASPGGHFAGLSEPDRQLWHTILPVAARCSFAHDVPEPGPDSLEAARLWVIARARRAIEGPREALLS